MEATPTPWQQHDEDYCPEELWGDLEGPMEEGQIRGYHVATFHGEHAAENAAFARRAVNAFPELVAALEGLEDPKESGRFCDHAAEPCRRCERVRAALQKARSS